MCERSEVTSRDALNVAANLLQLPDGDAQLLDFFVFLSAQPDDITAALVRARCGKAAIEIK